MLPNCYKVVKSGQETAEEAVQKAAASVAAAETAAAAASEGEKKAHGGERNSIFQPIFYIALLMHPIRCYSNFITFYSKLYQCYANLIDV